MADEATIRSSLRIYKTSGGNLNFNALPTSFTADVDGAKGPTPGAIDTTVGGTDVDLSQLTTPGFCWFHNQDETNYVTVGIWDPENSKFFPLFELLPGEAYVLRLARDVEEEYQTGTGTTGAATNRIRV